MATNKVVFRCGRMLLLCWMCLGAATNARAAVFDSVTWTITHPGGATPNPQNFAPDITKGQPVELQGNAVVGAGVVRIISTTLLTDPNGLIAVSVPDTGTVKMTTNAGAAAQAYALTIGGLYEFIPPPGPGSGTPIAPWAGTANAQVKEDGGGGIEIGNVVRGPSMPYSVPPGKTAQVKVMFSDDDPKTTVVFRIEASGAAPGEASIEGGNSLSDSGELTIKGVTQTRDYLSGSLKIIGRRGGLDIAESGEFRVCAHPKAMKFTLATPLLTGQIEAGVKHWGARYHMNQDDQMSDSEHFNDLNGVRIREHLIPVRKTGFFLNVPLEQQGSSLGITDPQRDDLGLMSLSAANMIGAITTQGGAGNSDYYQFYQFRCLRCGCGIGANDGSQEPVVPASGFLQTKRVTLEQGKWYLHVCKRGYQVSGCGPGSVAGDTEQKVEIKD